MQWRGTEARREHKKDSLEVAAREREEGRAREELARQSKMTTVMMSSTDTSQRSHDVYALKTPVQAICGPCSIEEKTR